VPYTACRLQCLPCRHDADSQPGSTPPPPPESSYGVNACRLLPVRLRVLVLPAADAGVSGPREGENDHETYFLVQELAEQGVADVSRTHPGRGRGVQGWLLGPGSMAQGVLPGLHASKLHWHDN